jgi:competence protein ComGC
MMRRFLDRSGFSTVSVLIAMAIVALLYFGYFKVNSTVSEKKVGIAAIDASRAVACRANRQTVERAIVMWSVNHPDDVPSLEALERDGIHVPSCPEGGSYELVGREVHCSKHP